MYPAGLQPHSEAFFLESHYCNAILSQVGEPENQLTVSYLEVSWLIYTLTRAGGDELSASQHSGLEHWECAAGLHWRGFQYPPNVHHLIQL